MMAWPTILCGALLVMLGVTGYFNGTPNPDTGELPKTAFIPAYFGAVLIVCGLLAFVEKLRKHVMHLAAMVGLVGFAGGFAPVIRKLSSGGELDFTLPAIRNGLLMSLVCLAFVGLCVKSFVDARLARKARERAGAAVA